MKRGSVWYERPARTLEQEATPKTKLCSEKQANMVKFASTVAILLLLTTDNTCHAFAPTNRRTPSISRIAKVQHVALSRDIHRRDEATQLHAKPFAATALPAASLATISALELTTGGIFSGSLHAIAGPDHLAALIPRCCGLKWYSAARVGAIWGLGHGFSATLLGMAGFLLKKGVNLTGFGGFGLGMEWTKHAGSAMELAIGISLIIIGLLGVKEAKEWSSPSGRSDHRVITYSTNFDGARLAAVIIVRGFARGAGS